MDYHCNDDSPFFINVIFIISMKSNFQFFRNNEICENREIAISKVNEMTNSKLFKDGNPFICRYFNDGKIETIFAIYNKYNDNGSLTYFDSLTIQELRNDIKELQNKLNLI